jgi:hypothetical protein
LFLLPGKEGFVSKAAVKLFRDPLNAEKVAEELKAKGFKGDEIGVLARSKEKRAKLAIADTAEVTLPQAGATTAMGAMTTALAKVGSEEVIATLASSLGISEEVAKYYDFGISVGGVLISVLADEARLPQAQDILRAADVHAMPTASDIATSPGFALASRMSKTDPLDAKMTGDFRKY